MRSEEKNQPAFGKGAAEGGKWEGPGQEAPRGGREGAQVKDELLLALGLRGGEGEGGEGRRWGGQ